MEVPSMRELLEAGVHFGHQVKRWNPKMSPYIFTARDGVHVLDLGKTVTELEKACQFVKSVAQDGGKIIFLGTKRQAQPIIREEAERCGAMYVVNRWIGGLLTNFETVSKRIARLSELETKKEAGEFKELTKKEQLLIDREIEKLNRLYGGVRQLNKLPDAIFVVDVNREINAVLEANKRGIPVVAVCDTNVDPILVDWPIPGNDDAIKSIKILTAAVADAVLEGKGLGEKKSPTAKVLEGVGKKEFEVEEAKPKKATKKIKETLQPAQGKAKEKKAAKPVKKVTKTKKVKKTKNSK